MQKTHSDTLMAFNPITRMPPICLGEKLLGHLPKQWDATVTKSYVADFCRIAQVRRQCVTEKKTCNWDGEFFFLNTKSLRHSEIDQHDAAAPSKTLLLIPDSHVPIIFGTLRLKRPGCCSYYKPYSTSKTTFEKQGSNYFIFVTKTTLFTTMPVAFC